MRTSNHEQAHIRVEKPLRPSETLVDRPSPSQTMASDADMAAKAITALMPGLTPRQNGEPSQFKGVYWHGGSNVKKYFGRTHDGVSGWRGWRHQPDTAGTSDFVAGFKMAREQGVSLKAWLKSNVKVDQNLWEAKVKAAIPGLVPRDKPPSQFKVAYYHASNSKWFGRMFRDGHTQHLGVSGNSDAEVAYKVAQVLGVPLKKFLLENLVENWLGEVPKPQSAQRATIAIRDAPSSPSKRVRANPPGEPSSPSKRVRKNLPEPPMSPSTEHSACGVEPSTPSKRKKEPSTPSKPEVEPATQDDLRNVKAVLDIWAGYEPKDFVHTLKLRQDRCG